MSHEVTRKKGDFFFFLNLRGKNTLGNFKDGVRNFVSHLFAPSDITLEK